MFQFKWHRAQATVSDRRWLYVPAFAAVILSSCGQTSKSVAESSRPVSTKTKWTVMVYMNAKNNLECDALDNFADMESVGSTDDVQVVAELGRPTKDYGCGDKKWTGVYVFHVEKGKDPIPDNAIKNAGVALNADMGSARTLGDFVDWSRKEHPAQHYLLIIWNHGQGWRFQAALRENAKFTAARGRDQNGNVAPLDDSALGNRRSVIGGYKSVSFDDDSGNFLYNSDIESELRRVLGGKKLDVLGFDACLMSMIETGYAMKDIANVMVSSEELEPGSGWSYKDFLSSMNAGASNLDQTALGKLLVASYQKEYGDRLRTTLSAISLQSIEPLAKSVSALADQLRGHLESDRNAIQNARAQCNNYGKASPAPLTNPIDLDYFSEKLASQTRTQDLVTAARDVREKLRSTVIANYASKRVGPDAGYGSAGISIYFPRTSADFNADAPDNSGYLKGNTDHPVDFVQQQAVHWADFIHDYLRCKQPGDSIVCPL